MLCRTFSTLYFCTRGAVVTKCICLRIAYNINKLCDKATTYISVRHYRAIRLPPFPTTHISSGVQNQLQPQTHTIMSPPVKISSDHIMHVHNNRGKNARRRCLLRTVTARHITRNFSAHVRFSCGHLAQALKPPHLCHTHTDFDNYVMTFYGLTARRSAIHQRKRQGTRHVLQMCAERTLWAGI